MSYAPVPGQQSLEYPANHAAIDLDCVTIEAQQATIKNLTATVAAVGTLNTAAISVNSIVTNDFSTNTEHATTSTIGTLTAGSGTIINGNIPTLSSNNATISTLTTTSENVSTLVASTATATTLGATTLNATTANVDTENVTTSHIGSLILNAMTFRYRQGVLDLFPYITFGSHPQKLDWTTAPNFSRSYYTLIGNRIYVDFELQYTYNAGNLFGQTAPNVGLKGFPLFLGAQNVGKAAATMWFDINSSIVDATSGARVGQILHGELYPQGVRCEDLGLDSDGTFIFITYQIFESTIWGIRQYAFTTGLTDTTDKLTGHIDYEYNSP